MRERLDTLAIFLLGAFAVCLVLAFAVTEGAIDAVRRPSAVLFAFACGAAVALLFVWWVS